MVEMGQQDLYQSDFYEDKSRFADVFNGVLFNGKEVMKPEELENEDSVMVRPENRKVNRESTKTIRGICGVKFSKTRLLFKVKNISFFQ